MGQGDLEAITFVHGLGSYLPVKPVRGAMCRIAGPRGPCCPPTRLAGHRPSQCIHKLRWSRATLGPWRNERARASAVIKGHEQFSGTAGRRASDSCSWDGRMRQNRQGVPKVGAADGQQPADVVTNVAALEA